MSVSLIINIIIFMNAKPYRFSTTDQKESKRHPLPPPQKKTKKTQGQPQSMLMFKPIWNFGIIKVSTLLVHM